MEHYELRLLLDYLHTGAQAVNTWGVRPTPLSVGGELERDERGEVVSAEIFSPVTGGGVEEELRKIVIIVDGIEVPFVSLSGIRATVMAPPKDRIWADKLYMFGEPGSNNPLRSTTIKYKHDITVACLAGPTTAITQDYRVRLWGYVYKADELPQVFGEMGGVPGLIIGGEPVFAQLIDRTRGRIMNLSGALKGRANKGSIIVDADNWLTLPGGKDQSVPKINPLIRFAYNANPTNGLQGDYQMRFGTQDVAEEDENMYFEFDDKDALLVTGLGIKADLAGDLARTGLKIDGDYHPKGGATRTSLFPTTLGINELNFGHLAPYAPVAHPYYKAIPKLDKPYLIWNEIGTVVIRDDGTAAIIAGGVTVALTGVRIGMRG